MSATVSRLTKESPSANGLALIISNDYKDVQSTGPGGCNLRYLKGAEADSKKMAASFQFLKFAVHHIHNQPIAALMDTLQAVTRQQYPKSYRRLAIVFSGHGFSEHIYAGKGEKVALQHIFDMFSAAQAPQIGAIAKMFFIDACRGSRRNEGIVVPRGGGLVKTKLVPQGANTLVAYSTILNYMSYETMEGGIWMSKLAEELKTDNSICDILTHINSELIEMYNHSQRTVLEVQQPTFYSQLNEIVNLYSEACETSPLALQASHPPDSLIPGRITSCGQAPKATPAPIPGTVYTPRWKAVSMTPCQTPPPTPGIVSPPHGGKAEVRSDKPSSAGKPRATAKKKTPGRTDSAKKQQSNTTPATRDKDTALPGRKPTAATESLKKPQPGTPSTGGKAAALLGKTAKEKLEYYVTTTLGRPKPTYNVERQGKGVFQGTVYAAQIGRVHGLSAKTKAEAEETAAQQMLNKI